MTRSVAVLAAVALAASGCDQAEPRVPHSMIVSPAHVTVQEVGDTVAYRAQVLDTDGTIIYEADIRWSSGNERIATVSSRGVVTTTGPGSVEIVATHGAVSGSGVLEVRLAPARLTVASGDAQSAPALSALPEDPAVLVQDEDGIPIPDVMVTFRVVAGEGTVEPEQAVSDTAGVASARWTLGLAEGEQRLGARVGSLTAEFTATATEPELAIITRELDRARADLSYRAAIETVGIRDEPLAWSVTAGALPAGLRLDSTGVLSGTPVRADTASFTATVRDAAGRASSKPLTLLVCAPALQMQPGDVLVLGRDDFGECPPLLPSGADGDLYRIAALRAATGPLGTPPVTLRATAVGGGPVPPGSASRDALSIQRGWHPPGAAASDPVSMPRAPPAGMTIASALPSELAAGIRIAEATAKFHGQIHEEARRLVRGAGRDAVLPDASIDPPAAASGAAGRGTPSQRLMLRPYSGNSTCNPVTPVPALLVAYDDHLAIYQDSVQRETAPVRARDARQVLDYYVAYGAETIDEYFGGVADINGDGRVTVLASPAVPEDVAGFVWPGDFLSGDACAASNEMELIYINEQLLRALGPEQENRHYQALPTVVHEMKHVSSLYRRTAAQSYHPTWIEEGTAEIAAERSSRKAMEAAGGVAQEDLLTRDDYPPRDGSIISPENYGMLTLLARTTLAYTAYNNSLVTNPAPGHSFYGSSWHFHRFLGDAYGGAAQRADGAFFVALNDSTAPAGTAGIEQMTGKPVPELIVEYATAMMLNGTGVPQPERTFHTYDFPSATHQLLRPEFQPEGLYPWPRTGPTPAPFRSGTWVGGLAPGGIRFYDFRSDGTGSGIELEVVRSEIPGLRLVFSRLR